MREVLFFLVVFLLVYIVVGVAMAFVWTYLLNDRYWRFRERLEEKKREKLEEKYKKLNK